jgi:hypothetical protein
MYKYANEIFLHVKKFKRDGACAPFLQLSYSVYHGGEKYTLNVITVMNNIVDSLLEEILQTHA